MRDERLTCFIGLGSSGFGGDADGRMLGGGGGKGGDKTPCMLHVKLISSMEDGASHI